MLKRLRKRASKGSLDSHREDGSTTLGRFLGGRSDRERKAIEAFIKHAKGAWKKETGKTPLDDELRDLLRMVYIGVYDFELGIQHDLLAESDIRAHVVAAPKHAKRVWKEINQLLNKADQRGLCIARPILRSALSSAGIRLKSPPDYAEDIAFLEKLTKRHLARLGDHTVLRFGTQRTDEVHIKRCDELSALAEAAKAGHILLTRRTRLREKWTDSPIEPGFATRGLPRCAFTGGGSVWPRLESLR